MPQKDLHQALDRLVEHWKKQRIGKKGKTMAKILEAEANLNIRLPQDFREYFTRVNGMGDWWKNDTDNQAFSFYSVEELATYETEPSVKSGTDKIMEGMRCLIFMDYIQKSWWYGIITGDGENADEYEIAIIDGAQGYKVITNSLAEFIDEYIQDSPALY